MRTLNEMGSMQVIYIALTSIVRLDGRSWAMCSTAVEAWASIAVVKGLNACFNMDKRKLTIRSAVLLRRVSSTCSLAWPASSPTGGWRARRR